MPDQTMAQQTPATDSIDSAYDYCIRLAQRHYENFPVASWFLPRALRKPVAAIYAFARHADDLADEGDHDTQWRLTRLENYRTCLQSLATGLIVDDPIFIAVDDCRRRFELPLSLFDDLLTAFIHDVTQRRYATTAAVLDYCRCSANPVGRLLLYLNQSASGQNLNDSDAICTALQLINFLQDIEQDYVENDRIYIPEDILQRYGVDDSWFAQRRTDQAMRNLINDRIEQARTLLLQGAPLAWRLRGRFGLEIRLIVAGGLRICDKLAQQHDDVFSRPRLDIWDKLWMLKTACGRRCPDVTR